MVADLPIEVETLGSRRLRKPQQTFARRSGDGLEKHALNTTLGPSDVFENALPRPFLEEDGLQIDLTLTLISTVSCRGNVNIR